MTRRRRVWLLIHRASLGALLLLGFYALAFALMGVSLVIVAAVVMYGALTNGMNSAFVQLDAHDVAYTALDDTFALLGGLIPRWRRNKVVGVRLLPTEQPVLFGLLTEVARQTRQPVPAQVYLTFEANASVFPMGGVLGLGRQRALALGLPLLQALTLDDLRAVLVHEFGHYHGGDVSLGPFLHTWYESTGRTLRTMIYQRSFVRDAVLWYGNFALRTLRGAVREQEWAADALAYALVGGPDYARTLRRLELAATAFRHFVADLNAAYQAQLRPPLAEGYALALGNTPEGVVEEALRTEAATLYDTHPPMRERIRAAEVAPGGPSHGSPGGGQIAAQSLQYLNELESALVAAFPKAHVLEGHAVVPWAEIGARVWVPRFQARLSAKRRLLSTTDVRNLSSLCQDMLGTARWLGAALGDGPEDEMAGGAELLMQALAVHLFEAGWHVDALPGEPLTCRRADFELQPTALVRDLRAGALSAEQWAYLCDTCGLEGPLLAPRPL